jgi:hypothetical protein
MIPDILGFLGDVLRWFCFLVAGFALGRFTLEAYGRAAWQVQVALVLGFFLMIVGIVNYAASALAAAFLLGAGIAFLRDFLTKADETSKIS